MLPQLAISVFLLTGYLQPQNSPPGSRPLQPPTFPVWRDDPRPLYHSPAPPGGPSAADSVDLTCGSLEHEPYQDLFAPNNYGPEFEFDRIYTTALAVAGKHETGMAVGWRHNFSITGSIPDPKTWGVVRFEDPKGAVEEFNPVMKDGKPTGAFPLNAGDPFLLQGVPSSTVGHWDSFTWQENGNAKWVFQPCPEPKSNTYRLCQIYEVNGKTETFKYDDVHGGRLVEIDDAAGVKLLSFEYTGAGLMDSATSSAQMTVYYSYDKQAGQICLASATTRVTKQEPRHDILWKYEYQEIRDAPFLVAEATPKDSGWAVHRNVFDLVSGKEVLFVDANGNRTEFLYKGGRTTVNTYGPDKGAGR